MNRDLGGGTLPAQGVVLCFDFGLRRTGVAVGDLGIGIAHPVATLDTGDRATLLERIGALVREWAPVMFVVGMPMHAGGEPHELAGVVRKFAGQLHGRFGLPVRFVDETLSSHAASEALRAAGVRGARHKAKLDQVAAQQILQGFFEGGHVAA
jgi:putative Holliday junction resolvase